MKKYLVDTNYLLRFLLNDIPDQSNEVEKNFEKAKRGEIDIIVDEVVILELEFALRRSYKLGRGDIVKYVGVILNLPYIDLRERQNLLEAFVFYNRTNLDITDCFLGVKAKNEGAEVLSFDKDFKKLQD